MSEIHVEDAPAAAVTLPCPLPGRYPTEPPELTAYRQRPGDERQFMKLRRAYRDAEDWRALATLLVLHASALERSDNHRGKAAELCVQAYELWLERVKDRETAAHALARAVLLRPDNARAQERLRKLYEAQGAHKELISLLRFQLRSAPDVANAAALHLELAELLERHFVAIGEAVGHLQEAIRIDPHLVEASERLIRLYLQAGAWQAASELMARTLEHLDPERDRERIAALHRRLAAIEAEQFHNVAAAARHLQAALKAIPDDIDALRSFGILYLSSGKATDDGVAKAADIFYKAAELARRRGDKSRALKLLRRSLSLAPQHQQASAALENTLIDAEDWLALDDLYREWSFHFTGADAVPILLRRADLLDDKLHRREEARQLYEEISRYQTPDQESWRKLEQIYRESGDFHALAALLDAQCERLPEDVSIETLLEAARVYREELGLEERAAVYYYKVLEREPFNAVAFEGYKEHWRRKHNWGHLRDLILYQIEQAMALPEGASPLDDKAFGEEFVELADICERRLGDIDGALDAWQRLASAYPRDDRPAKNIARIEKRARMWDNMVRVQEAELERTVDPAKRLDILKRLTQVYRDRQVNPSRAIELYNEILELSPNDVQATRALTALYDRAGDYARVVEMLREQHERSRSNTEKVALLRRMAELWHNELDAPDEAIWACEQILARAPADREALYRLQQILEEQERYDDLLEVLDRELKQAATNDAKIKILRRMARLAERELQDEDRAVAYWSQLAQLKPESLELADRLIAVLERTGRYEELRALLARAANTTGLATVRQVDYLLRLGQLAETHLDDPELARSSFERVLRSRPDHRGALEALVRLYRADDAWQPLVAVLGKLQELAETDEDAFRIAWERAEILGEKLDDTRAAAEILEQLSDDPSSGRAEIGQTLLTLYQRSRQHRKVVRQAEILLLSTHAPEERRRLYETIGITWLDELHDDQAALAARARYVEEFSDDLDGLWSLAELQERVEDFEGALATLERRVELAVDPDTRTETFEHMAEIAELRLGDGARALELIRRALEVDHFDEGLVDAARRLARQHGLWAELQRIHAERLEFMAQAQDAPGQVDVCLEASRVAEDEQKAPREAFDWARRGYFVAIEARLDTHALVGRLDHFAETYGLWNEMLAAIEDETRWYDEHPSDDDPDDAVERDLKAATIAETHLKNPQRAVEFLQRAHRRRPEDDGLADRLQSTAEKHGLWQAVIDLQSGRLARAATDLGRFDACTAIARIYEEELHDPEKAFEWLRKAWKDLRAPDPSLADDAFERLDALCRRHRLWPLLCDHHLDRARMAAERQDPSEQLKALEDAAVIFEERLADPMAAARVYVAAMDLDRDGEVVLPQIRRLGLAIDEARSPDRPTVGALVLLDVLQRYLEREQDPERTIELIEERARIREERLADHVGAMAEWLRVLRLGSENERALVELERLADAHDLWHVFLVLPAWQLEQTRDADERMRLLRRIAVLYEGPLERPEYALRSRLHAWRLAPHLPPREGEIDDDHRAIWRLAEQTGPYQTPPVPKDPLLLPTIGIPELDDQELWRRAGLDPRVLVELPSPHAPKVELAAPIAVPRATTEEVSLTELATVVSDDEDDDDAEIGAADEVEEIEDLEVLDVEEIEELSEDAEVQAAGDTEAGHLRPSGLPPPPPRPPDAGLPPLPRLAHTVLPPRPRVASAWEEVALAYAEVPTADKRAQADVALVLARLWEEGAGNLERAFQAHEQALLWVPEYDVALESIAALAERHEVVERLLQAYERLLAEAAMPEHVVAQNLRIARVHESRDELGPAETRYRNVLAVVPTHIEALEALCRIYQAQERHKDYVDAFTELLDAQMNALGDDEIVERTLELARLLVDRVDRKKEAIERIELLVRRFPARREVHQAFVELLVELRQWQRAIEAMRVAADALDDADLRIEYLGRMAEIYEEKLGLPDRAIAALVEVTALRDDDDALAELQRLYLETGRFEPALPVIERRLELLEGTDDDQAKRISLLVAKARVLQEGMGDEKGATETLEELVVESPDNDEAVLGLSRLYRKTGRLADGIDLLRARWEAADPGDKERHVVLTRALAEVLDREGHDPRGALGVVEKAIEAHGDDVELLRLRVQLARDLHETKILAESLARLPDHDALLEAADLFRTSLSDGARSLRLYSRVLAEAKKDADEPDGARRLASALEGLVKLRIQDGDIQGAIDFMDRQLSEMKGPTIRAQLLTEMGRITYRSTGDVDAARKRFDAALAEDSSYVRAKIGLGEVLLAADQIAEAEKQLEDAVETLSLSPNQEDLVEALLLLGRVLEANGRSGEAYRRLTTAARHAPDNLEIRAAIMRNRSGAGRWRDTITTADQVEQIMAEGVERTPKQIKILGEIFTLAAEAEARLGNTDNALARFRKAAEMDPGNARALEPLIGLCQERGALVEAARHAATLARQTDEPATRGQRYIEAGMLFHDAAAALADGAEPTSDESEADLRKAAFEALRLGLDLLEEANAPVSDRGQLEVAFRASAEHDPATALRCLERLLLHQDLGPEHRLDLLLEGVRISLAGEALESAERFAHDARKLAPDSAAAVLANARVLEATDRVDDIEYLVESYFAGLSETPDSPEEAATRVELLLRLAEIQASIPDKAIAALERAAEIDASALTAFDRKTLAELYERAGATGARVLRNHLELLAVEPLYEPSLRALARHCAEAGDVDRAHAVYGVLALADPEADDARAFLEQHRESRAEPGELVLDGLGGTPPADAGMSLVLLALWEGGAAILSEHLPRVDIPPDARISPLGDSFLAKAWSDALKRLGQSKVALVDEAALSLDPTHARDVRLDQGYFEVRAQHPPIIIAGPRARTSEDPAELRFALGRAIYFTRPEAVFAAGLRRVELSKLLSAAMLAFHPRHGRRKHHVKNTDDPVAKLSQELARKLPMRVSRQITAVFKDHEREPFDSRVWRSHLVRTGNRVGLTLGGDLSAAIRVMTASDETPTGEALRMRAAADDDLRDLLYFATTEAYVTARRKLGYTVTAAETQAEADPV